ncbi:maintenance of chromosomes 6-like isoform X2 [Octopus vulgaris]|uniref:Maintenance of chromosomes 6-like isoform X2 n=1 Tax=Octopus vulgaris TaxID=6645 RepID=A0AA36F8N0_OCTVU|nr:maintenance of chromosomes 6-like isoform X2 [Octopus vulgaris]
MPKRQRNDKHSQGDGRNGNDETSAKKKSRPSTLSDVEDVSDDSNSHTSQNPDFLYQPTMGEQCQIGYIQKIVLKNFMCHHKLEVKFGPHVNFIIGRNGSGKSAVVSAIIVGLGGKASATSRSNSVKSFIKNGKQSAEIIIHLSNEGADAFKPDLFGNQIVIERKLCRDGVNGYRIKSSTGQIISTKREDLRNVLDSFNILVDNPVVILNQEISRSFLQSKNASDKYRFFLQATQLAQIQADYDEMKVQKNSAKEILAKKEESFPELESEVKEWEKKYKAFSALENQKEKIKALKSEMAWSLVIEKESHLAPHLREKSAEQARLPKFEQKVTESNTKLQKTKEKVEDLKNRSKDLVTKEKSLLPELKKGKEKLNNSKATLRSKGIEIKKVENSIRNLERDAEQIKERIHEIKNSDVQQNYEVEKQRRETKIKGLKSRIEEYEKQKHKFENQVETFQEDVSKYKDERSRFDTELRNIKRTIDYNQRELDNLKLSVKDNLRKYGSHIPDIMAHIEMDFKRKRFHRKPVGPLGEWIKVKDPRWALAIEVCLKSLITAFCVHDHDDCSQLEKIFREVSPKSKPPSFIISQFQSHLYDVSKNTPKNCPYPTILDMLDIKKAVVGNCLIDQRTIENIILIEDPTEARKFMRRHSLQFIREAFTLEGDQIFPEPNYRYYSSNSNHSQYLSANMGDVITNCENQLKSKLDEQSFMQERMNSVCSLMNSKMQEERKASNEIKKLSGALRKLNLEIEELQILDDIEPIDVMALEEEHKKITSSLSKHKESYAEEKEKYKKIQSETSELDRVFSEKEQQLRSLTSQLETIREEEARLLTDHAEAKSYYTHYEKKFDEQQKKISQKIAIIEKINAEIEVDKEKACLICPDRINTRRTTQNIQSEITEINKRVEATERRQGDCDFTTRRYHETKEALRKIRKEVGSLKNFLNHLEQVMEVRDKAYKSCRQVIALRMKQVFIVFLHSRNYMGQLNFDHDKGLLEITVNPVNSDGKSCKDVKSLSGGERSFATVCFILALWCGTESPFRCLDEFDVFMDMVNRRICMDMMLQVAKEQRARQFIFLTPQDMSHLNYPMSRIFRMPDPVRMKGGQKTLNLQPAANEDDEDEEAA